MTSDEKFLKFLDREMPGIDWDGVPSLESFGDVWVVERQYTNMVGWWVVCGEYQSCLEAIAATEGIGECCRVVKKKPWKASWLNWCKEQRDEILSKELINGQAAQ